MVEDERWKELDGKGRRTREGEIREWETDFSSFSY